jgi:hypothetical protein
MRKAKTCLILLVSGCSAQLMKVVLRSTMVQHRSTETQDLQAAGHKVRRAIKRGGPNRRDCGWRPTPLLTSLEGRCHCHVEKRNGITCRQMKRTELSKWFCDTSTGAATGETRCGSFVGGGFGLLAANYG